jgi:hypothetical protein
MKRCIAFFVLSIFYTLCAQADVAEYAAELPMTASYQEQTGVRILYAHSDFKTGTGESSKKISIKAANFAAQQIQYVLSNVDPMFVRELTVVIVSSVRTSRTELGGYAENDTIVIAADCIEEALAHELVHVLDYKFGAMDATWEQFNPANFSYYESATNWKQLEKVWPQFTAYFVSNYAILSAAEDRAETGKYLLSGNESEISKLVSEHPQTAPKFDEMRAFLEQIRRSRSAY